MPPESRSTVRDELTSGTAVAPSGHRRLLQQGHVSITESIAEAIVLKQEDLVFLCDRTGDVPFEARHGLGLYFHDCRYLNGYSLRISDQRPEILGVDSGAGFSATFQLTNPDLNAGERTVVPKESVGIEWHRTVDGSETALRDVVRLTNYGADTVTLHLTIALRAEFESLFQVRGAEQKKRGRLRPPEWDTSDLILQYDGADHIRRLLRVCFDPEPARKENATASFDLTLPSRQTVDLHVTLHVREESSATRHAFHPTAANADQLRTDLQRSSDRWLDEATCISSDSGRLNLVLNRSLRDLHMLRSTLDGHRYFSAGVPWFIALFGRDSLIAAFETLAYVPWMAEDTLRLLAAHQGTSVDDDRDEQPGKIMHELRTGEMAHLHEIPQTPSFGSVDATPLFLVLLARHALWTGRLDLFKDLSSSIDAALGWIDRQMSATGFLTYISASDRGLANQGWKDSGDAISNKDGTLATPPIALIEVQGYVYLAKSSLAALYRRSGDNVTAERLLTEANELRERVNTHFWSDRLGTYALALEHGNRRVEVASSNPGQALWTGIATADRAKLTIDRLFQLDMFSGWGIRTLSTLERRYNPIGYHIGTVWPHDNALIAAGCRRYGFADAALRLLTSIVDAADRFEHGRLPEVFAGFDRHQRGGPIRYPVACHPQAWAAGSVPYMIESALGLEPDGFERRLRVHCPQLPDFVRTLTLDRLSVGIAKARIVFKRNGSRTVIDDVSSDGDLQIEAAEE
jgi:glycogen debranching enzyme